MKTSITHVAMDTHKKQHQVAWVHPDTGEIQQFTVPNTAQELGRMVKRLYRRYHHLTERGKASPVAIMAVVRELAGFVWAMLRQLQPTQGPSPRPKESSMDPWNHRKTEDRVYRFPGYRRGGKTDPGRAVRRSGSRGLCRGGSAPRPPRCFALGQWHEPQDHTAGARRRSADRTDRS